VILNFQTIEIGQLSEAQRKLGITAGGVPSTRLINTTAPLAGGGDLSADRTLSLPVATALQDGYLSAASFAAFAALVGVPTGGTTGQQLTKLSNANFDVGWSADAPDTGITQLTGDVTAGPGSGSQAATIAADAVTNANLRDSGALSVIGRSVNSSGNPADISAISGSDAVLRESGGVLGFGTIASSGIANLAITNGKLADDAVQTNKIGDESVTFAKMQLVATDSLLGRDTALTGKVEQLTVGGGIEFTGSGGIRTSAFTGDVTKAAGGTAQTIPNDTVTNAKLANMAANTIKGNNTAGTTDPSDLTASQVSAMLPLFTDLLKGLTPASGGGAVNFLRADATWATPAGTGINQLTGDVTAGPGSGSQAATIAADAVTNAKLADMAANTVKVNATAGAANPTDLAMAASIFLARLAAGNIVAATATEATALLNTFTSLLKGLVPASGGGTTTFLRADGSFASPTIGTKQTEVDFGDVFDVNSQTFTVTDADVSATSRIDCWLSGDAPTGKDADDVLAEDPIKFIAVPSSGTFDLYVEQPLGCLNGKYKINYRPNVAV
jgi:hypothetical protein